MGAKRKEKKVKDKILYAAREITERTNNALLSMLRDMGHPHCPTSQYLLDEATQTNANIIRKHLGEAPQKE